MPSLSFGLVLLAAATWTTFFSFFTSPGIRGFRNFGILACYVVGLIGAFFTGFLPAVVTWLIIGLVSGILYFAYEIYTYANVVRKEGDTFPTPIAVLHGLIVWPIMLPEVIEYVAAELGLLKTESSLGEDSENE